VLISIGVPGPQLKGKTCPLPGAVQSTVAPDVLFRIVGDEAVLLNLKTELYLGLDPVGTRMWTVLTTAPSIKDAYETLLQEYDVEPERCERDLFAILEKLQQEGLIEVLNVKVP